jgi:hypothetical protein
LNVIPRSGVKHDGKTVDLAKTGQRVEIVREAGTLQVGDESSPLTLTLSYAVKGGEVLFRMNSDPWAIVSVNGISKGKAPVNDVSVTSAGLTKVEFKRPPDQSMTVLMRFNPL